jgi:type IV leader peptidase family protein
MLIALMDVDSYEIDLRILLGLITVGFCIRLDVVEGAILSMVAGLILYITVYGVGKWIWKEEVFGMGDVYFLAALGPYFSPSQILFIGLFSFVIGGGVVICWMILSKRNQLYAKIPFAPFISISALLTYLFSIQWF